jgi:hypothetical protein
MFARMQVDPPLGAEEGDDFPWYWLLLLLLLCCCVPAIAAWRRRQRKDLMSTQKRMSKAYRPLLRPKPAPKKKHVTRAVAARSVADSVVDFDDDGMELVRSTLMPITLDVISHAPTVVPVATDNDERLLNAVREGDIMLARNLLDNTDANIDCQDANGATPLHLSVQHNDVDMVKSLMKHRPNVEIGDDDLENPVQLATRLQHTECYHAIIGAKMLPESVAEFDDEVMEDTHQHVVKHWPKIMPSAVHRGNWTYKDANPDKTKKLHENAMMKTHLATKGTDNLHGKFEGHVVTTETDV